MRTLLIVTTASLLIAPLGRAQQTASTAGNPPGLECVDRLDSPDFPAPALKAGVDGSVYAFVRLTPQATVGSVETETASAWAQGSKLLPPAVEKAVRASKFKSDCGGKTVDLVFRYHIWADGANSKVTTKTEPPNLVDVHSVSTK